MKRGFRRTCWAWFAIAAVTTATCAARPGESFAELIQAFSEPGGYFDTDNLISNEGGYGRLAAQLSPVGGAYIGVGPEQNFTYIGKTRADWAFLVDIRRDNMLYHLLLNAFLAESPTALDYLRRLFSRPVPASSETMPARGLLAGFEATEPSEQALRANLGAALQHIEQKLRVKLTAADQDRIGGFLEALYRAQLGIRFRSHGRPPRFDYPSYRTLLEATDEGGQPAHFLQVPSDYQHVRKLALEGRLVPVIGDLAGNRALKGIGDFLRREQISVTTFYTSNVEFYLLREGRFEPFVENVRALPVDPRATFIRSYFAYRFQHPLARRGQRSTLLRQRISTFLEHHSEAPYFDYWDLCTRDYF